MQPQQAHLQYQLRAHHSVVQGRVAASQEHPLIRFIPAMQVLFDDAVAGEQVVAVFYQGDDPDALWVKLADPVLHGVTAENRPVLLTNDHVPVVCLYEREFLGRGRERQDDLLYGRFGEFAIEAAGDVPGGWHALKRLHHGLAHVLLDAGIGDPQRERHVATKHIVFLEEFGVADQQLANNLVVRLLALGVPHLLVAAQVEHVDRLLDLTFPLQHALAVGEGRRGSVVRVLGAHHLWHEWHVRPPGVSWRLSTDDSILARRRELSNSDWRGAPRDGGRIALFAPILLT